MPRHIQDTAAASSLSPLTGPEQVRRIDVDGHHRACAGHHAHEKVDIPARIADLPEILR